MLTYLVSVISCQPNFSYREIKGRRLSQVSRHVFVSVYGYYHNLE